MKDIQFVLFEQLRVQDKILKFPRYSSFSKDDMVMLLEEAKKLAVEKIAPTNPIGDKKGCKFNKGVVNVPEEFHEIYKLYCEAGWVGAHASRNSEDRACQDSLPRLLATSLSAPAAPSILMSALLPPAHGSSRHLARIK
jgi:hypothetical protein